MCSEVYCESASAHCYIQGMEGMEAVSGTKRFHDTERNKEQQHKAEGENMTANTTQSV